MSFDIRLPIGALFLALGGLLCLYGVNSDAAIYRAHALGVNINLAWGSIMAAFGAVMLALTRIAPSRNRPGDETRDTSET